MKYVLLLALCLSCSHSKLKKGDALPHLTGVNQDNLTVDTKDYSKDYFLVYFYPMADTSGCTKQACSIRDSYAVLQKKGVRVLGVSTDDVEKQKKFQKKNRLPFELIADTDKTWADAFKVPVRLGFASRQAFLYKDGKLIWFDRTASTEDQAKDVLKVIGE